MKCLDNSGFSLIEIMVTIAIVAIVGMIAIPNMISWRGERQLRGAANNLLGDFQLARMQAIRESETVALRFNVGGGAYSVFFDPNNNGTLDGGERTIRNVILPTGITIQAAAFSGGVVWANYDTRGMPVRFGSATLRNVAGNQLGVTMNRVGRLRIQ